METYMIDSEADELQLNRNVLRFCGNIEPSTYNQQEKKSSYYSEELADCCEPDFEV